MLNAIVNQKSFEIEGKNENIFLNGEIYDWDIIKKEPHYHIIHNNKSYNAELLTADYVSKKVSIKINGNVYEVDMKDQLDLLLGKLGMSANAATTLKEIKAPMPGLILHIHVEEGVAVKKGDSIMILEAMKMENILKSPGDGIIKVIKVKTGTSVEKNQILIEFQ